MRLSFLIIVLGLLCCTVGTVVAGQLSGEAEWGYGEYRAEEGERNVEASYLAQRYSLLYETEGNFMAGRAGKYDLALGLEWASLRSEINDEVVEIDTPKILHRGDVVIAPGGLPFRLHLYSQDMHRTQFIEGGLSGGILDSEIITDLQGGQHIRSGATLMVGIRNGSYMGRYRDVLAQMPRLLVDYQEDYVRDLESRNPQHYRTRNLAFVSLNKKDNWFHYRYLDFRDFTDSSQNFVEKSYILGTIDHTLQRQWINLTNWIKVSVDGTYTSGNQARAGLAGRERYDLNLFATARRPGWNVSNFSTFQRVSEGGRLTKDLELPFFLSGELNRDTSWRLRLIGSREAEETFDTGAESDRGSIFASAQVEAFRQQRFIVVPQLEAEVKRGSRGTGENARARVEIYSNSRYDPRFHVFGSYTVARFAGTTEDGTDVNYWEQEARAKVETDLGARVRTGFEQKLLYGTGLMDREVAEHLSPAGDLPLGDSLALVQRRDGDVFRTTSTWFGEHRSAFRLDNRLEASYELLLDESGSEDQIVLRHSLRYDRRAFVASMRNQWTVGGSQSGPSFVRSDLGGVAVSAPDRSFFHLSSLRYSPTRVWDMDVEVEYNWSDSAQGSTSQWIARQQSLYRFFSTQGVGRKIAEMGEELEYERFTDVAGGIRTRTSFTLLGNYYPSRTALLGARVRYRNSQPEETSEIAYFLTAGLNFTKFQVSLDYAYGTLSASQALPDRREHRWEAKMRKTF